MEAKEKEIIENKNIDKNDTILSENKKDKPKKGIRIFGITIWRILAYFIIYSIVGFVVETTYGAITKGVIESRQSFLYGPFCAIYGLGACIMILGLQKFKKHLSLLFIGGFILGGIVEYAVSYLGELIFHVRWWDYSNMPFNINGRICVRILLFLGNFSNVSVRSI